jgi:hypothetical protein
MSQNNNDDIEMKDISKKSSQINNEEEINTGTNNYNQNNLLIPIKELTNEETEKIINKMKNYFINLNTTQESIVNASNYFLDITSKYPSLIEDLLRFISEFSISRKDSLVFLYLINDLIQKWKQKNKNNLDNIDNRINLPEKIYNIILDIILPIYISCDQGLINSVEDIIKIWEEYKIYSQDKINELKFHTNFETLPKLTGNPRESEIIFDKVYKNYFSIDDNLIDLTNELGNINDVNRRNVISKVKDLISRQFTIYQEHLVYLQEIDKIIEKIDSYNKYNIKNNNL